ncbi:MAG TPA: peptidylprolyl isomerase [Gemmatimonadaceae bacterium]|nr:peptidylprolyl isomerase [Gemmatimonadaceae bacterium]
MTVAASCHSAPLLHPNVEYWRQRAPDLYDATVSTTKGDFVLEIHRDWAPHGADRFYQLARARYFDDSRFSRVVPNFIVQFGIAGDPRVNAVWATRTFADDSVKQSNVRGTIGFAMTGPNARTTQLYISLVDNSRLDAQGFSPIGRVVRGMDVVDRLYSGYGETSGGGVRAGKQGPLVAGGNAYVDRTYPLLDHLIRVTINDVSDPR